MPDRTCIACATPIDPSRRADARTCCVACRTWAQRHPGEPRPVGPQSYTCEQCGEPFVRDKLHSGKRPRFCGDQCWERWRHLQRPYGEWRKTDPFTPRSFECVDCGEPGSDSGAGPIPSRCPICSARRDRLRSAAWQRANTERSTRTKTAWARENPERVAESLERTRPQRMAGLRRYQIANADRVREWKRSRENKRRAVKASVTIEDFQAVDVFIRDGWVCGICDDQVDRSLRWPHPMSASLDHVIPLSRGGAHALSNVQLAHLRCNVRKGDSLP